MKDKGLRMGDERPPPGTDDALITRDGWGEGHWVEVSSCKSLFRDQCTVGAWREAFTKALGG